MCVCVCSNYLRDIVNELCSASKTHEEKQSLVRGRKFKKKTRDLFPFFKISSALDYSDLKEATFTADHHVLCSCPEFVGEITTLSHGAEEKQLSEFDTFSNRRKIQLPTTYGFILGSWN